MKKRTKFILLGTTLTLAICSFSLIAAFCIKPSNGSKYDVKNVTVNNDSPLKGKTFYWLGSSVTLGMESSSQAVADFLAKRNGAKSVKEAVSGTTLIDEPIKTLFSTKESYVSRLNTSKYFDTKEKVDYFICQISTNDAKNATVSKYGKLTDDDVKDRKEFDLKTSIGAMEYIVSYAWDTWHCPIYFYSGASFGGEGRKVNDPTADNYQKLISETKKLACKWTDEKRSVKVIDLFNDEKFNDISQQDYTRYMHDPIHPYKAGYLQWWTPYFENFFINEVS